MVPVFAPSSNSNSRSPGEDDEEEALDRTQAVEQVETSGTDGDTIKTDDIDDESVSAEDTSGETYWEHWKDVALRESAVGPTIPQEIIEFILLGLNPARASDWISGSKAGLTCALVCSYWAELCRPMLWPNIPIRIESPARAEEFRRFWLSSAPPGLLQPIAHLLQVWVIYRCEPKTPPWLHKFFLSPVRITLDRLTIQGPYRDAEGVRAVLPRSPWWGLPRGLPPSIAQCSRLWLQHMSSASLNDVISCARSFNCTEEILILHVTWPTTLADPRAQTPLFPMPATSYPQITVQRCTDPAALFLQAAGVGLARGPLHSLTAASQVALTQLVKTTVAAADTHHGLSFDMDGSYVRWLL